MPVADISLAEKGRAGAIVQKHKLVFDVIPALEMVENERRCVGYDIELMGTHEGSSKGTTPGCDRCVVVWNDLERLARLVLPDALQRMSIYEFGAFDRSLHSTGASPRDDVRFVISIRHKREYFMPVDRCEDQCLRDIVNDLLALGAQRGTWSELTARVHLA